MKLHTDKVSVFLSWFVFWMVIVGDRGESKTIAVIGDSISTGAVADSRMEFDHIKLWERFEQRSPRDPDLSLIQSLTGSHGNLPILKRLWPSLWSYVGYMPWYGAHLQLMFSTAYLDTLEYSWASQLAMLTGVEEVLVAAHDGARMEAASEQSARLLSSRHFRLPEQIFIFFTGNDLCSSSLSLITPAAQFRAELKRALDVLYRGEVGAEGVDIYVVSYLSILQLRTSTAILEKKITAYGKPQTCASLNHPDTVLGAKSPADPMGALMMNFLPRRSADICPTVFDANIDFTLGQSSTLANRILAFRQEVQSLVRDEKTPTGIRLHYLPETADLMFAPEDIANDCFHLSIQGQNKVAKTINAALQKR